MGLTPVRAGELATIVTSLEMRHRPPMRPIPESRLRLARWQTPNLSGYRTLFARVGSPWLWYSRLAMPDERLTAIVHDPSVQVYAAVDARGVEIGMLELDCRQTGQCELSYFALVPELVGQGNGRWLMAEALARAWAPGIERVWVHTCTLDHPRALPFYMAAGFRPYARTVETFPDPRLIGLLPREVAPQVPLLEPS